MITGNEPINPCNYVVTPDGGVFNSSDDKMGGLTIRQYIATQCMAASRISTPGVQSEILAEQAVLDADALIAALNNSNKQP